MQLIKGSQNVVEKGLDNEDVMIVKRKMGIIQQVVEKVLINQVLMETMIINLQMKVDQQNQDERGDRSDHVTEEVEVKKKVQEINKVLMKLETMKLVKLVIKKKNDDQEDQDVDFLINQQTKMIIPIKMILNNQ